MSTKSTDSPARPLAAREARSREESVKRWLAVLIALVALLVAITTFLETDASLQAAKDSQRSQESAIKSTGARARGQQEVNFATNVIKREFMELGAGATRLYDSGDYLGAKSYLTATKEITKLSELFAPAYLITSTDDSTMIPDQRRYEVDTWVMTATLLSEQREAAAAEGQVWGSKSNNYIAAITVFAVTLFLFGLASTLGGFVRWLFVTVGLSLAGVTFLGVLVTTVWPIHQVPDGAIVQFAYGYGLAWQAKYQPAIEAYSQAIKTDPNYANAYSERGLAWLDVQPPGVEKAIQDFEAARGLGSEKYDLFWNLGWAYYLAGDYAKSIPVSQRALELNSKVCGPAFNVAIARLAMGKMLDSEADYESAIARCERIRRESLAAGQGAPYSLWQDMAASARDIEDLLCQTHQRYCYTGRDQPDVRNVVNRDAVLTTGEKYLKRIKEALTALEYPPHAANVTPTGAKFTPLTFGNEFYDEDGTFQSYVVRDRFAYDGPSIYALLDYSGMNPNIYTVWKIYHDGKEDEGLRYAEPWPLEVSGKEQKGIDSWYVLKPGRYDVEVYGDGEWLSSGSFEVDASETLTVTAPSNATPGAPVRVGLLLFSDDFANNNHGWWTGAIDQEGKILNGEFSIVTHVKDGRWRVTCEACGGLDNFYYEANTRYIQGATNWGYGLVVRGDRGMHQGYLFSINANGFYTIGKAVDNKYIPLVDWTQSSAIRPKGVNRLGVLARDDSLEFFINGQSVKQLTDASLSKSYIGVSVETTDLQVAFSQVRVWQVQ